MSVCPAISGAVSDLPIHDYRRAARAVGEHEFVELLRWYRAVNGLPDRAWGEAGSYRAGINELPDAHAQALLTDLRRLARNARHRRRPLDGKPTFAAGRTLSEIAETRKGEPRG